MISISLIAWSRYKLTRSASGPERQPRNLDTRTICLIIISWLLPVVTLLPALLEVWGRFGYEAQLASCNLLQTDRSQAFKVAHLVARAFVPCSLIVACYCIIYAIARQSRSRMYSVVSNRNSFTLSAQRDEMRLSRMVLTIFLLFAISYIPCVITSSLDWVVHVSADVHRYSALTVYIGSALNPLVYGLLNTSFRKACLRTTRRRLGKRRISPVRCERLSDVTAVTDISQPV